MRLTVSGLWQTRPCRITWEDGRVETEPDELLPLLRLHAWLQREGLIADGGRGSIAPAPEEGDLRHPIGMLEVARPLLDVLLVVEDTLGAWPVEDRVPDDPFVDSS